MSIVTRDPFPVRGLEAAADLLVQEFGRQPPVARTCCFCGGCLTGPATMRTELDGFLSYLMRCTVTGQPYTCSAMGASRCATTSTRPTWSLRLGLHRAPTGRGLQHWRGHESTARCSRRSSSASRSRAASSSGRWGRTTGSATIAGGSATWGRSSAIIRAGASRSMCRRSATIRDTTRRVVDRARVKLSVVIPAHNEVESIGATVSAVTAELRREQIPYEVVVVDDASRDGTRRRCCTGGEDPAVRCASRARLGWGEAVRSGLDESTGDARRDRDGRPVGLASRPRPLLPGC